MRNRKKERKKTKPRMRMRLRQTGVTKRKWQIFSGNLQKTGS